MSNEVLNIGLLIEEGLVQPTSWTAEYVPGPSGTIAGVGAGTGQLVLSHGGQGTLELRWGGALADPSLLKLAATFELDDSAMAAGAIFSNLSSLDDSGFRGRNLLMLTDSPPNDSPAHTLLVFYRNGISRVASALGTIFSDGMDAGVRQIVAASESIVLLGQKMSGLPKCSLADGQLF